PRAVPQALRRDRALPSPDHDGQVRGVPLQGLGGSRLRERRRVARTTAPRRGEPLHRGQPRLLPAHQRLLHRRRRVNAMTQPQKFQFKLFIETPEALSQEAVIPVFHDFIREKALPELLIDVADYRHVHEGPGVVLIGHGYDLYVDEMDGRPGLLFSRKREATGSVEEILRRSLAIALAAA